MDFPRVLPRDCISKILSFTSPKDACRSSLVSSAFKEIADSDDVWRSFLPSDCKETIAQSTSPALNSFPKKQLYFLLCDRPVLLPSKYMSFALEKLSGKKCYRVGARGLKIFEGDNPRFWKWTSIPDSRFAQVAELNCVWWLEIEGRIETRLLSLKTTYGAFLLFKFGRSRLGFRNRNLESSVSFEGSGNPSIRRVVLDPPENGTHRREDGWMEVEMGEFFNEDGDDGSVVSKILGFDDQSIKEGLIVEGVEFRPKNR